MSEEVKEETPWEKFKKKNPQDRPARVTDLLNHDLRVSEKIAEERFAICLECPELIPIVHVCKKCGCPMKNKVKLSNASCPLQKWSKVEINQ